MIAADLLAAKRLKAHGIKMPLDCVRAARAAKLDLPYAAALLMMETGGGANVFGHDPTISIGGAVTRQRYAAYKALRQRTGKMQGVGPTQLTWYSYQDEADKLGGCDVPRWNMQIGFSILRAHIDKLGTRAGFAAYNGSGPAAVAYGRTATVLVTKFRAALNPKPTKPVAVLKKAAAPVKKAVAPAKKAVAKVTKPSWTKWVVGDTDCKRDVLVRLGYVARDYQKATGKKTYVKVRCGKRTFAEQLALYRLYIAGKGSLAAKPGTSNHETGDAADCGLVINGREVNIGVDRLARVLLRKHGLCLPVRGEKWHVERGSVWKA